MIFREIRIPKIFTFKLYDVLFGILWGGVLVFWWFAFSGEAALTSDKVAVLLLPNLAFLFLPISRYSIWQYLMGIPFDKAVTYHRWIGVLVSLLI